ncbi:unnamed protein product, partial [Cuscuta europaea]
MQRQGFYELNQLLADRASHEDCQKRLQRMALDVGDEEMLRRGIFHYEDEDEDESGSDEEDDADEHEGGGEHSQSPPQFSTREGVSFDQPPPQFSTHQGVSFDQPP